MQAATAATTQTQHERGREAFERLVLPLRNRLYQRALSWTHSAAEAEDLVQDTLLRAFDRFETFRPDGATRAWLHAIMQNLYRDTCRRAAYTRLQYAPIEFFDPLRAPHSVEHDALTHLGTETIRQAISSLPSDCREVVVLADMEGLTYTEIAGILQVPVGTVRSRLSRARTRLRRKLLPAYPTEAATPH